MDEYRYRVVISRPRMEGGGQDPVTGQPIITVPDRDVYDGPGDWQDGGKSIVRALSGALNLSDEPEVYFPEDYDGVWRFRPDDAVKAYRGDYAFAEGEIKEVRTLDNAVTVRRRR
jgi:hypothetical protein